MYMKQNKKINTGYTLVALLVLLATGCYYDKEELLYPGSNQPVDCTTVPAKFSTDVLPLVTTKCAIPNCHDASAAGGKIFQNYTQISGAKDRINVRAVLEKSMPKTGSLLASEVSTLKCWIESGAPNN
jgi:hypothetical protein